MTTLSTETGHDPNVTPLPRQVVADAITGLAYHGPDFSDEFVEAASECFLALLPGATKAQWEDFSQAHSDHYDSTFNGTEADRERLANARDTALDILLSRLPAQRGASA